MSKGVSSTLMGLFVLALALVLWRLTASLPGWFVLFAPGVFLVTRGIYVMIHDES